LDITLDKKAENHGFIKVKVNKADYQSRVQKKLKEYSKNIHLKGFRKGKVPVGYVKKMYGKDITANEIYTVLQENLQKFIREEKLKLVGEMLPQNTEDEKTDWLNQDEFEFSYEIGLVPDFVYEFKKLELEKIIPVLEEEKIGEVIGDFQKKLAKKTPLTEVDKEFLQNDLEVEVELRPAQMEVKPEEEPSEEENPEEFPKTAIIYLDEKSFLKQEVCEQFFGKKVGDEVAINIENDLAEESEEDKKQDNEIEDKKLVVKDLYIFEEDVEKWGNEYILSIKTINHFVPAELNEEFYQQIIPPAELKEGEEIKDETAFREKIKEVTLEQFEDEAQHVFKIQAKDMILEKTEVDISDDFLNSWFGSFEEKIKNFDLNKEYIKWSLIANRIAEDFELKVEEKEIEEKAMEEFSRMLQGIDLKSPQFANFLPNMLKEHLEQNNGENYKKHSQEVLEDKVMEIVKEKANVQDKEMKTKDLEKFLKDFVETQQKKYAPLSEESTEEMVEENVGSQE